MDTEARKQRGAYYTPDDVVRSLVHWAVRRPSDRLLDPACGDGRFLTVHPKSVGVEDDPAASSIVHQRAPGSLIHEGDFFAWAEQTRERFECAAGNPPFIRFQRFSGLLRARAQALCKRHGANFSSLSSSWAPFIVATAALLKPGGRMAFVVPAEIGHAPYAQPVLEYLTSNFERVLVVAVRYKLFPELSEDCWLLYADGYGGQSKHIELAQMDQFGYMPRPPSLSARVALKEWFTWNRRLRSFLLPRDARELYLQAASASQARRLGDVARVGIGYVTGANDFFHLKPSQVASLDIPNNFFQPTVRNGKSLVGRSVTTSTVERWTREDEPFMLLRLSKSMNLPGSVKRYLESSAGQEARRTFKCRSREPWYVVPDVTIPDAFLSYMSGDRPALVANKAGCAGTNSVHVVKLLGQMTIQQVQKAWNHPLTMLSCEIEGHPLGGGMLKIEPREASRVMLANVPLAGRTEGRVVSTAIQTMQRWRHYA